MSTLTINKLARVAPSGTATDGWHSEPVFAADYRPRRAQLWDATLRQKMGAILAAQDAEDEVPVVAPPVAHEWEPRLEHATGPVPVRLACLKLAAEFLAGRPDATGADVRRLAQSWEAWVTG